MTFPQGRPSCFVITPLKEPYISNYEKILHPTICQAGLAPVRGDEITQPGVVIAQIWAAIKEAEICIADISDVNANVVYEIGFAHAMGKRVILLTKKTKAKKLPFDLTALRCCEYNPSIAGWEADLGHKLLAVITASRKEPASAEQVEAEASAVWAATADVERRELEDFLAFFGPNSLKSKYKAVFFDAQLPRLDDFCDYFSRCAKGLPTERDVELLNRLEASLPRYKDADLCMVKLAKPPKQGLCALPKGIREIVPSQELEAVLAIDPIFQKFGGKIQIAADHFHKGGHTWPAEGCISLGLGFNHLTVEIGEITKSYKVFYQDQTDDFFTYAEDGTKEAPRPETSYEYALLARVLLDLGGLEPTPYLVCAGHTADGTAAACQYLAKNWHQLWQEKLKDHHMTAILYHKDGQPSVNQILLQPHFIPYKKPTSSLMHDAKAAGDL
jgi:hypothetical protein